jgi:hypothetical protein
MQKLLRVSCYGFLAMSETLEIPQEKKAPVHPPARRVEITAEVVKEAIRLAAAAKDSRLIQDWFDVGLPYLQLRQRGRSVTWYIRAKRRSQKLGLAVMPKGSMDRVGYLSVKEARAAAARVYDGIEAPPPPVSKVKAEPGAVEPDTPEVEPAGWTWADLTREFQENMKGMRKVGGQVKLPSQSTQDDVRYSLSKAPLVALGPKLLTALLPSDFTGAIRLIQAANGHRSAEKSLTYAKSAMTWALGKRTDESGLGSTMPWWEPLLPPDPPPAMLKEIAARNEARKRAKEKFTVKHLGELLARHEEFCADRTGRDAISPGIRWGLWWLAYTANRRASVVALERARLFQVDEHGQRGWGRATWPPESMKGKLDFWLPLPPSALHVANSAMSDWASLVKRSHDDFETQWVFASTRRIGRLKDNPDVAVYPSSLNAHIRAMRGQKKSAGTTNYLEGVPQFWLHLVRTVATNYLSDIIDPAAVSAMLSHTDGEAKSKLSETTRRFYSTGQKMELKALAMNAWCKAIDEAYAKAGGKTPMPSQIPLHPMVLDEMRRRHELRNVQRAKDKAREEAEADSAEGREVD